MSGSKVDVKVVLLGKEYSGKTSLVERYLHSRFSGDLPYQNTIGAAYGAKKVDVGGGRRAVVMGIWDTAGSEKYHALSRVYYRGAWAAVICYDLTDTSSFDRAKYWVTELMQHEPTCRLYLCGTKRDIVPAGETRPSAVAYSRVQTFAEQYNNAAVFETSAKSGENVAELFARIARDYATELAAKPREVDEQRLGVVEVGGTSQQQPQRGDTNAPKCCTA